jgi:hypothetical protein
MDAMVYLYPGSGGSGINIHLVLQPEPLYRVEKTFASSWTKRQPTA